MKNIMKNINIGLKNLNANKYLTGILALMLNVLSKHVTIELSKTQQAYLQNSFFRQILIFTIVWVSTRDVIVSLILTGIFVILTQYLFNENSHFCILPENLKKLEKAIDIDDNNILTENEIDHAINILNKAKQQHKKNEIETIFENFKTRKF